MSYRTAVVSALSIASAALAGPSVFHNIQDNGYFTPFNSSTSSSIRYGDSGWFGSGADAPVGLEAITLGLVVTNSSYLENQGAMKFTASTVAEQNAGRWMVMDAGDVDGDGDPDVVLGSFVRGPTTVPVSPAMRESWRTNGAALLLLENVRR